MVFVDAADLHLGALALVLWLRGQCGERETRQSGEERGDNELLRYIDARFMRSPHVEGVDGMDSQI